jgi:hypothetical protein
MRRIAALTSILMSIPVIILMTGWGALAIYYSDVEDETLRIGLSVGFALAVALAFMVLPNRKRTLTGFLMVFAGIAVWWLAIPASN